MAIDSSLWMVDIPAGSYAIGDTIPLEIKAGPANVRTGRGPAFLKNVTVGSLRGGSPFWKIHVRNSNWVDDMQSLASDAKQVTSFATEGGNVTNGNDAPLYPNSGWEVYAECASGGELTQADSLFALIDIDYPDVSSVANPDIIAGIPTSIPLDQSVSSHAFGASKQASWNVTSVDVFKAGYVYCLNNIELYSKSGTQTVAFIALSNAAGMGGLTRIVPNNTLTFGIRKKIQYSTRLVKGPMDVMVMAFQATAASNQELGILAEFVKK